MTFKQWLRQVFGPRVQGYRASRGDKSWKRRHRCVPRLELLEDRLAPATLLVTNTNDSGTGSLRDAITASVSHTKDGLGDIGTGNDTIQFSSTIDGGTIKLTSSRADNSVLGQTAILVSNSDT